MGDFENKDYTLKYTDLSEDKTQAFGTISFEDPGAENGFTVIKILPHLNSDEMAIIIIFSRDSTIQVTPFFESLSKAAVKGP